MRPQYIARRPRVVRHAREAGRKRLDLREAEPFDERSEDERIRSQVGTLYGIARQCPDRASVGEPFGGVRTHGRYSTQKALLAAMQESADPTHRDPAGVIGGAVTAR